MHGMCRSYILILLTGTAVQGLAGMVELHCDYISMDQVGNMAIPNLIAEPGYSYSFVNGARGINDGSDFNAVRKAFGTWINEPDSAIWATEKQHRGRFMPGAMNRKNEISWISPTIQNSDPWSAKLNLSERIIAAVFIWYDPSSGKVLERDLYFNDVDMQWRTQSDGIRDGGFYVEHIALHEIGHLYGLRDVYNPGQKDWEEWMGSGNEDLTMYGYSDWRNEDVTLEGADIAAMAALHPSSSIPEPRSISLFGLAAGILIFIRP